MKTEIFEKLIRKQEKIIEDLKKSISSKRDAADLDENETQDMEDYSHQDEFNSLVIALQEQLVAAQVELDDLKEYKNYKVDSFTKGALIETEDAIFIVGPSVRRIEYNDKNVICVSDASPVYAQNEGRSLKDGMLLNDKTNKILQII